MEGSLGHLCLLVALIIIVIISYDKYMKTSKGSFNQGPTLDAGIYGSSNQEYPYYNYTSYSTDMYRNQGGINPYTLAM